MGNKKQYTAPSGTTYVQKNDSVYDWSTSNGASGQIQLNPNSGGPTGYYRPAEKKDMIFNTTSPLSQDYVNRHVRNIQQGLKSNGFVVPDDGPSMWHDLRDLIGRGIIRFGQWVTPSDANGGTINYLDLFR